MSERDMVKQFHEAMGLPVRERPEMPSEAERVLRCRLLLEECEEFIRASGCRINTDSAGRRTIGVDHSIRPDLAAMAHENADVRIITLGTDLTMGSPTEVYAEVMRANMSKLGDDGRPVLRADGKVMKGPKYTPPDVARVLKGHGS
jgi:predicted HAD superfamily Cof-like phosphohydrolase